MLERLKRQALEIERLRAEVKRLKDGDFTEEEFQNLCHKMQEGDGPVRFGAGCILYNKKLFGEASCFHRFGVNSTEDLGM